MNKVLTTIIFLATTSNCAKVPLTHDYGAFHVAAAHWFENEKVAYVFFELAEKLARLREPVWEMSYQLIGEDGVVEKVDFHPIDFSNGVHLHSVVDCGEQRLCGSYSFRSDHRINSLDFRLRYDPASDVVNTVSVSVANHIAGDTGSSFSALAFGVFDESNERLQVRVQNNFGYPADEDVARFGMKRQFRAGQPELFHPSTSLDEYRDEVGNALLFPAAFCPDDISDAESGMSFVDQAWFDVLLSRTNPAVGACFSVSLVDKEGQLLVDQPAFSRRNPELSDQNLTFHTPLSSVHLMPVIVSICEDDPSAASMIDDEFFEYQKFILGLSGRATDICFRIGQERKFANDFTTHLVQRLSDTKAEGKTGHDYAFVVIYHHNFSSDYKVVSTFIANALTNITKGESEKISPRLVGGFVYDSSVDFRPTPAQRQLLQWCPQELPKDFANHELDFSEENCTLAKPFELDLRVINFVMPMGPLPSRRAYRDYLDRYGDAGLAQRPRLELYSVQTDAFTRHERGASVSFFGSQRYSLAQDEAARLCLHTERAHELISFRFRTDEMPDSSSSYNAEQVNELWAMHDSAGDYLIGIEWRHPFWGAINYRSALSGTIGSIIPFTRRFSSMEELGDSKWQTQFWNFAELSQHCRYYCDHPFFDEAGVYQPSTSWRSSRQLHCPIPRVPTYGEFGR